MYYDEIKDRKATEFKRLTGVKKKTYYQMVELVKEEEAKKIKSGRQSKLSIEDQILLTLSYWREYRTQFHLAASYGIHESTVNRIINRIEDIFVKSKQFKLPKKRELRQVDWIVVMVDATEVPIERPKKNRESITQARKSIIA